MVRKIQSLPYMLFCGSAKSGKPWVFAHSATQLEFLHGDLFGEGGVGGGGKAPSPASCYISKTLNLSLENVTKDKTNIFS